MGKSKKKSQSNKNAGTEQGKGQKAGATQTGASGNTKPTQVESQSGTWVGEDLNVSGDKATSDSSMLEGDTSQSESYSADNSFSEPRRSGKHSPIRYSRENDTSNYKNNSYNTRKSEPYRGGYKDKEEDRRDKSDRRSWNTAPNKRRWDGSNNLLSTPKRNCPTTGEERKLGKTISDWLIPRKGRNSSNFSRDNNFGDAEFDAYRNEFQSHRGRVEYKKVKEIVKNLFDMDKDYSLAHCVAEDMNMGSGIAVQFRRDFRRVDELLNQMQVKGGLAILKDKTRYIYYLVTKTFSYGKPTYQTLFSSLKKLKEHVIEHKVEKLAMPRIGCGLDRLEWPDVKFMLEFLFRDLDVEIIICNLEPTEDSPQQRHRNSKVTHEKYPIEEIEKSTVIIYFSSEDELVSEEMLKLDEKFHFLREFRVARKNLGDVIFYNKDRDYLLCGCIVRKSKNDQFKFDAFQNCLSKIQKENKKTGFYYYAFQAFKERSDKFINYKIINILRNTLYQAEVYVCWPGDLRNEMAPRDQFGDSSLNESKEDPKSSWRNESPSKSRFTSMWGNRSGGYENRSSTSHEAKSDDENWDDYYKNDAVTQPKNNSSETATSLEEFSTDKNNEYWGNFSKFGIGHNTQNYSLGSSFQQMDNSDYYWSEDEKSDSTLPTSSNTSEKTNASYLNPDVSPFTPKGQNQNLDQAKKDTSSEGDDESTSSIFNKFELFEKDVERGKIQCNLIKEQDDLRKVSKNYSRVCFAREDLIVETGCPEGLDITPHIGKLLNQGPTVGKMVYLKEESNFCYLLIIKKVNESPTIENLLSAIENLKEHAKRNAVKKLVVPKIDLDGNWPFSSSKLKCAFQYVFEKSNIEIIFGPCYPMYSEKALNQRNSNKIQHVRNGIHQMKKKSAIIYLASADGFVTPEMEGLDRKFDFIGDFKKNKKFLGAVVRHKTNEDNVLYGCIVKKDRDSPINFEELQNCMMKVKEGNKENFSVIGIQAVQSEDATINFKIATVLLNILDKFTISMCWPGNLREKMPQSSRKS